MKKLLILSLSFATFLSSYGQAKVNADKMKTSQKNADSINTYIKAKTVKGPLTTEPTDISNEIENAKTKSGNQLLATTGHVRLFADVNNGNIEKLSATTASGSPLNILTSTVTAKGKIKCRACVTDDHGTVCWWINCEDLPRPPSHTE